MQELRSIALVLILALAACGESAPDRTQGAREAEGEVSGGSISDDMLPLDQLRSQSPTIREPVVTTDEEEGSASGQTGVEAASGEGADDQPAPPETPDPSEG